jgi:hypothetical protein
MRSRNKTFAMPLSEHPLSRDAGEAETAAAVRVRGPIRVRSILRRPFTPAEFTPDVIRGSPCA